MASSRIVEALDVIEHVGAGGVAGAVDLAGRPFGLATIVEAGPNPATDGVVRWRRIDLCAVVERRFGVQLAERSMGAILRRLGFTRLSARPRHPQSDAEAQAVYKKLRRPGARGAAGNGAGQAVGGVVPG